jgi:catechol 2,3-dioxygenase-like lactoylglutathione lyase family enzyme
MNQTADGMSRRSLLLSFPVLIGASRASGQTAASSQIRVRGINHVTLLVSDVERSVDFYQGLFGMPIISRQGDTATNLRVGNGPHFLGLALAGANRPRIDHFCLGVENFDVDRLVGILGRYGVSQSDTAGPMRARVRKRGPDAGGASEGTPELYFGDPDGITVQLQDPRYCGGAGRLGNVCPRPEPSPKNGVLAVRTWSHCTNFVSDAERSNKFYQELFGLPVQAYQGPNSPLLGAGEGVQFIMFAGGGGGRGRATAAPPAASINHLCLGMDGFNPDKVIKALESYGIKPREKSAQGPAGPLVHYISMRMENRGGAKEGTPELYFTDPDGLLIQLQDVKYCGGGGVLGDVCS